MRDDEAMVLVSQQRLPAHENRMSKRQAACIAGIKPAQITDAFAEGVAGQLTSSEPPTRSRSTRAKQARDLPKRPSRAS
jgi:hypothetical protein